MNIAMRTVPLNTSGHYLKFDLQRNQVRMAYWYPRLNSEGKQVAEDRTAVKAPTIDEALLCVLGETDAPFHFDTVLTYLREQPWSGDYPWGEL